MIDKKMVKPSAEKSLTRQQLLNRKKKLKKKAAQARKRDAKEKDLEESLALPKTSPKEDESQSSDDEDIPDFPLTGPFERFKLPEPEEEDTKVDETLVNSSLSDSASKKARTAAFLAEEEKIDPTTQRGAIIKPTAGGASAGAAFGSRTEGAGGEAENGEDKPLSKKKLKLLNRPSVAALKQAVRQPDVVEMWDVCARDPLLLVYLKSYRNTVQVPQHWCAKRKYLQGKRGYEKPPFRLPDFIARTGIMEMRQTVQEKDAEKTLKSKMREKIRPKVGKVDINYQKLHDAFFKYQTKPRMTKHGDLYYEGKEFEIKLKEKKPGVLSEDLKLALGMPVGPNSDRYPPPWLIAMQRYGPPPSYPNIKIPGLNAPIPDGCAFGYHPGGWGKPPVDELGRPVYGDVFGNGGNIAGVPAPPPAPISEADQEMARGHVTLWGELESDDESDEEGEDESGDEDSSDEGSDTEKTAAGGKGAAAVSATEANRLTSGIVTPAGLGGLVTPSGISSVGLSTGVLTNTPSGLETPGSAIELRKRTIEAAMDAGSATPAGLVTPSNQLYRVLPEKQTGIGAGELMGSSKLYDLTAVGQTQRGMEVDNPRDSMLRKRPAGGDSQTPKDQIVPKQANANPSSSKKYKEFKF